MRRIAGNALLCVALAGGLLFAGCASIGIGKKAPVAAHALKMAPGDLDDLTSAYADRYVLLVSAATDQIKAQTTDLTRKHLAQRLKTESATSVYDIVTSGDAYGRLLDLTVAVTLQSEVYIDEDQAETAFGKELAPILIRALREARVEIWEIAAKALTPEQLDDLDSVIVEFRKKNPTLPNVINVRFSDFASSTGKSMTGDAWGGLFGQIDEARKSVDQARRFGEQAFYYGKRAPLLISWQLEENADEMASKPEFAEFLADVHRFGELAEHLPEAVAAERKAILTAFDERQKTLGETMRQARETMTEADQLTTSAKATLVELQKTMEGVQGLMASTDAMIAKYKGPSPPTAGTQPAGSGEGAGTQPAMAGNGVAPAAGATVTEAAHPFDIREYTAALQQATATARELNEFLKNSQTVAGAPVWDRRLTELQKTADDRVKLARAQSEELVQSIFFRVYLAIGALFLALVAYRLVAVTMMRRMLRADHEKSAGKAG
jgi:hypothetical protein